MLLRSALLLLSRRWLLLALARCRSSGGCFGSRHRTVNRAGSRSLPPPRQSAVLCSSLLASRGLVPPREETQARYPARPHPTPALAHPICIPAGVMGACRMPSFAALVILVAVPPLAQPRGHSSHRRGRSSGRPDDGWDGRRATGPTPANAGVGTAACWPRSRARRPEGVLPSTSPSFTLNDPLLLRPLMRLPPKLPLCYAYTWVHQTSLFSGVIDGRLRAAIHAPRSSNIAAQPWARQPGGPVARSACPLESAFSFDPSLVLLFYFLSLFLRRAFSVLCLSFLLWFLWLYSGRSEFPPAIPGSRQGVAETMGEKKKLGGR